MSDALALRDWCDDRCGWHTTTGCECSLVEATGELIAAAKAEAWDEGYLRAVEPASDIRDNPYRAAQVAPSRVPGEGS